MKKHLRISLPLLFLISAAMAQPSEMITDASTGGLPPDALLRALQSWAPPEIRASDPQHEYPTPQPVPELWYLDAPETLWEPPPEYYEEQDGQIDFSLRWEDFPVYVDKYGPYRPGVRHGERIHYDDPWVYHQWVGNAMERALAEKQAKEADKQGFRLKKHADKDFLYFQDRLRVVPQNYWEGFRVETGRRAWGEATRVPAGEKHRPSHRFKTKRR